MAQKSKFEARTEIRSSPQKLYGFFRNNMNTLARICPDKIQSIQLLEGTDYSVGCVKLYKYVLGSLMMMKVKIEAIDDSNKSITFGALEGDIMQLYESFKVTVKVGDGFVKWTIEYEKASDAAPKPDLYGDFAVKVSKGLDAYLLSQ
ncbi:hypothetical protein RJ640_010937 [Escallonia rubra]|uniref:Bet v I/Major latex protein domain-containing protein n=1 Tax=Escallonia rubra TaxID=112253 RepID=A0AA88RHR2_9ASTE|nr:hypothetical protein RJ640_010937 [Escallonia rubra]